MQRLVHTRGGAGCRAGLLVGTAAGDRYLLTCGHPFHRDEPFAAGAVGRTVDGAGRPVFYARMRAGVADNAVDAALIATAETASGRLPVGEARGQLRLDEHQLQVIGTGVTVRMAGFGFRGMVLAEGVVCQRGRSGSVVTDASGAPAAIVTGMLEAQVVLCPLRAILDWFGAQGVSGLAPVAFAIQGQ